MISLQKSVLPTNFLIIKLIELEQSFRETATLNTLGTVLQNVFNKRKQQFKRMMKVL